MQLPDAENAYVEERKITHYLLDLQHQKGGAKAAFFARFGFVKEDWQLFAEALCQHARSHPVLETVLADVSVHYMIEGELVTPDGRNPYIRTVWEIQNSGTPPRLITAYPAKQPKGILP